jgi:hypothetical protein
VTVERSVAVVAGVGGFIVVDRATGDGNFGHRPVKTTVGVAQRQGAEVAGDEDRDARVVQANACCVLVQVDRGAEGGAVVGRAGHGEGDVDVLHELGRVGVGSCGNGVTGAALDTHLSHTAQGDVGRCYASSCHKGSRSEENLFHGFSLVFTLKVHLKTDIRIEYASLSLVGPGIARKGRAVVQLVGLVVQTCHTDSRGLTPLARNEKRAGRGPLFGFGGMPQAQKEKESPRE